ncbi:MAG: Phosphatidyl-myo-inositol mannosyltransferase [candidate division WS2 bacterium]|nr:Phosphatidyl-myo-inositol mannosyltransferase [Candidatus Lithacetigena glycinireducens]
MKILFVTARFPYPLVKGDKIIPYYRLKHFSRKHEITLLSFSDKDEDINYLKEVSQFCKEVHLVPLKKKEVFLNLITCGLSNTPLQVLYYQSKAFKSKIETLLKDNKYDLIHVFMLRTAHYVSEYNDCPKIIEFIDSMELNMKRRASLERGIKKIVFQEETRRVAAYEKEIAMKFDFVIVVSDIDKKTIGSSNIHVVPLGVDTDFLTPQMNSNKDENLIVFTGNMGYFPNERAVLYFRNEIFPLIRKRHPNVEFWVIGGGVSNRVKRLENDSIKVLGFVNSMAEYINRASVSVAPMQSGSGMQSKILEALACGVPVVATTVAKGDIKLNEEEGLFVADEPNIFAERVVKILIDKNLQRSIAQKAPQAIKDKYSWETSNSGIEKIYSELINENKRKGDL